MSAYNDDLLFIHIPKCGGASVKTFLKDNVPGIVNSGELESKLLVGHTRLEDIEQLTGRAPATFKKILAVVRNPYEVMLSQFVFWANRHLQGGAHIYDVTAWRHVSGDVVINELRVALSGGEPFFFEPRHLNLTGFVADPKCEFHPYEAQFLLGAPIMPPGSGSLYATYGGLFRSYVAVNGEIPPNVEVIKCEELATALPAAVAEFVEGEPAAVPHLNQSPYRTTWRDFYTPSAARVVEAKCAWAFEYFYEIDKSLQ